MKRITKIRQVLRSVSLFAALFLIQNSIAQTTTGCWKSFSGGDLFALGITSNGQLWSWGYNPVKDILWIKNSDHLSIDRVPVFDFSGKRILTINENFNQINVGVLEEGIY